MRRALAVILLAAAGLPLATAEDAPAFRLALHLASPAGAHGEVVLGTAAGATAGYDRGLDRVQAPPPFGSTWAQAHAVASGERPELRRLQTSLLPLVETVQADLVIERAGVAQVTLSWSPSDLAHLPEDVAVELRIGTRVADARAEDALVLDATGDAPLVVRLHAYRIQGPPPEAPRSLVALLDPLREEARLQWDPPASAGGAPLRGYVVHRAVGTGEYAPLARVGLVTTFVDETRDAGEAARYVVTARSAVGEGDASNPAIVPGTRALRPAATPEGWSEREVARSDTRVPALAARTPAVEQGAVEGEEHEDAERYALRVHRPDGATHTLVLYSAGLLDARVERTLIEEREAATPPQRASASATYRAGSGGHDLVLLVATDHGGRAAAVPLP